jgi:FO synthase subunit 1
MHPSEVEDLLRRAQEANCTEALFTFGERPYEILGFHAMLKEIGYENSVDYLGSLCRMAIDIGLLPHSNPGLLTFDELKELKSINASMGLMLETTASLEAHRSSPGKEPELRIWMIEDAGRLKIPFTTGLLIGIGETWEDRVRSLEVIAGLHLRHKHIQEVIIQPFSPKPGTMMAAVPEPPFDDVVRTVALARYILPDDITIQVPPNLTAVRPLLLRGASDIGGVSPITVDYVNPEHEWPDIASMGLELTERLPIYPQYVHARWYSETLAPLITELADERGLRRVS